MINLKGLATNQGIIVITGNSATSGRIECCDYDKDTLILREYHQCGERYMENYPGNLCLITISKIEKVTPLPSDNFTN